MTHKGMSGSAPWLVRDFITLLLTIDIFQLLAILYSVHKAGFLNLNQKHSAFELKNPFSSQTEKLMEITNFLIIEV